MIVVSDTSPISNLAKVGQLILLQQIYGKVIIPTAVYRELTARGAGALVATAVQTSIWIEAQQVANRTLVTRLQNQLNEGEAEAIALAVELNADQLLVDERLGRREATNLGLSITGVLGILLVAKRRGLLSAVKPVMDDLITQAVFRVSDQLYSTILNAAEE